MPFSGVCGKKTARDMNITIVYSHWQCTFSKSLTDNGATTFSINTLSILDFIVTLSINDTQDKH